MQPPHLPQFITAEPEASECRSLLLLPSFGDQCSTPHLLSINSPKKNGWLVVDKTPQKNMKVSWDDDMPN